ncbi:anthrone oxygenase family protein [Teredinibacter franksiae]|uniref:anthrone oxygenase family protein n=1 Tax=Teredinibacter franksiae TaxID=2761453 RepID=UPI00162473B2|nr:anthrone oxygenase family protein [Teredinibacter franksiae]
MILGVIFERLLFLATFLCSLTAGFLFAFSVVVMPGLKRLNNREFIRAFQVIDGVIQNNQPLFIVVWVGSIVALLASFLLSLSVLEGGVNLQLMFATLVYIFGVQLPTFIINVPLNNKLQSLRVDALDDSAGLKARNEFEPSWNKWNSFRSILSILVSLLLISL